MVKNLKHSFAKVFFIKFRLPFIKFMRIFPSGFSAFVIKLGYLIKYTKWLKDTDVKVSKKVHQYVFEHEKLHEAIDYLEFGVLHGKSIKWWLNANENSGSAFVGFDTFEGLPEQYGRFKPGDMNPSGNFPQVNDERCTFIKGLFQETLPDFLTNFKSDKRKVVHVDCDLYSGAMYVLTYLAPYLKKDDILIFDDFGSFSCPDHGFRSFIDFFQSYRMNYEALAISPAYSVLAVKIQ